MQAIKSISIPEACHQSWQQMTPVSKGRHCQSCCKTVTDFTVMTNNEIINYLANKNNICGRFGDSQLKSINQQLRSQNPMPMSYWKKFVLLWGLITSSTYIKANAQTAPMAIQRNRERQKHADRLPSLLPPESRSLPDRGISGRVLDDTLAIPGAMVTVKGYDIKTATDINGEYKIKAPTDADTLMVSFIGYKTAYINISRQNQTRFDVKLKGESSLNEVVLAGEIMVRRPFFYRLWHSIIHAF